MRRRASHRGDLCCSMLDVRGRELGSVGRREWERLATLVRIDLRTLRIPHNRNAVPNEAMVAHALLSEQGSTLVREC